MLKNLKAAATDDQKALLSRVEALLDAQRQLQNKYMALRETNMGMQGELGQREVEINSLLDEKAALV